MESLSDADKFFFGREKDLLEEYKSLGDEGFLGSNGFGFV